MTNLRAVKNVTAIVSAARAAVLKNSDAAAEKAGLSKKDTESAVNAAIEVISQCLAEGDKVQLVGFGAFEVKSRAERIGRNPKTKESIKIPASKVPVFKPGKALKDIVSQ